MSDDRTDLGSRDSGRDGGRPDQVVRVFLVDDHPMVRRSVRELLDVVGGFEVVGEAGSAATAAADIVAAAPDVALVDLHLGDGSGIEVCRAVRARTADVATLVLTAEDAERAQLAAVLADASGYVLKLVRGSRLWETVRAAAAGDVIEDRHRADALRYVEDRHAAELDAMTWAERSALRSLFDGRSDDEIAAEVGVDPDQAARLVATVLDLIGLPSSVVADAVAADAGS